MAHLPTKGAGEYEEIVLLIRHLNMESGQSLRQVQVPEKAYALAKSFLKWVPNVTIGPNNTQIACRFKVLYHHLSRSENIYTLLMNDAGYTPLAGAKQKIEEWQEATKSLLRYALNLKLAPKRPEFQRMKLSSSYYVYQVAKKLQGAEKILLCMGYEPVHSATHEIQELKYGGEVSTSKVVDTAADLVILHSELDRISGLVTGAIQEGYRNVILRDILEARSDPSDTLDGTLRRSLSCTMRRLATKTPQFVSPKRQQLEPHPSQALAPPLPPRTHELQQQKSVHLPLPVTRVGHPSLEKRSESQLSSNSRQSSAPQQEQLEPKAQPPPSPLMRNLQSKQSAEFEAPPNSKDMYSKVDKTVDKSQGKGIDSVDPAKYFVYPDGSPSGAVVSASTNVPLQQKSGSIPIDPLNLPEPAFDAHDLEMFHQEEAHTPEYYASSHLSIFIDARSAEFSGFSGPDLDDHLTFRSDHSGHMGLSESEKGTVHEEAAKSGGTDEQPCNTEREETCSSNSNFGDIHAERVKDVVYEDVELRITPLSGTSFTVSEETSANTKPDTCTQIGNQPQHVMPGTQSQRKSATEVKVLKQFSEQRQQRSSSMSERPPIPVPRTKSNQNLLVAKPSQTPPSSPSHVNRPHIKPRRTSPKTDRSNTASVVTSDKVSTDNTASIQFQERPTTTADGDMAIISSHVTSIDSYSKSEQESLPCEALNSLESSSPNPSIETSPCMSSKSDPCHSTSPDNASSACSGDMLVSFTEKSGGSLGSYVSIDITPNVKDQQQTVSTSLENIPIRQRSHAFSSKSVKSEKLVSEASKSPKDGQLDDSYMYVQGSTDISNATPCWYCTNLITSKICDVCGNVQKETKV